MYQNEEMLTAIERMTPAQVRSMITAFELVEADLNSDMRMEDDEKAIYRLQGSSRIVHEYLSILKNCLEDGK